jgi:hypothetical protein
MNQKLLKYRSKVRLHSQILKLFHVGAKRLHSNRLGPKLYTNLQRLALLILHSRSGKSLRRFVDELPESRWISWLGFCEIPSKSSLHSWQKQFSLSIIRKLNTRLLRQQQPAVMAIDGTGVDSHHRSRHYEKRALFAKTPYVKLDLFIDVKSQLIFDWIARIKPRHDVLGARTILKRTRLRRVHIVADKGYDCRDMYALAHVNKNTFYAPIRTRKRSKVYGRYRRQSLKEPSPYYPLRNSIESCIHALKAVRVYALRCKLHRMKKKELAWHIVVHNMERLIKACQSLFRLLRSLILDTPLALGKLIYSRSLAQV